MFKRGNKENSEKKASRKKIHKISYDEHFTRATESVDLAKNQKFTDINDGISKREKSNIEKLSN